MATRADLESEIDALITQLKRVNASNVNARPIVNRLKDIAGELYLLDLWDGATLIPVGEATVIAEVAATHPLAGNLPELRRRLKNRFDVAAARLESDLAEHDIKVTVTYST